MAESEKLGKKYTHGVAAATAVGYTVALFCPSIRVQPHNKVDVNNIATRRGEQKIIQL